MLRQKDGQMAYTLKTSEKIFSAYYFPPGRPVARDLVTLGKFPHVLAPLAALQALQPPGLLLDFLCGSSFVLLLLLLLLRKSEALLAPHLHPGPDREKLEAPGTFFSLLFLLLVLCGCCYGGREAEVSGEVGGVEGAGDGCRKWKEKKEEIKLVGLHKKPTLFPAFWTVRTTKGTFWWL